MGINLETIIDSIADRMDISVHFGRDLLKNIVMENNRVNVCRLELAGFFDDFQEGQMQVIDNKGLRYLNSLEAHRQGEYLSKIFSYKIPCIIFTDGNKPDERFTNLCQANSVPILASGMDRWDFIRSLENELEEMFAPRIDYRGTMMEVFGVGVLITGKSNVGKSECAIDLLRRGHRLIGDDLVEVIKRGNRVLIAKSKFPISHRMELRGIGIIDIVELYGISAVKDVEKIELIIALEKWVSDKSYERLGIEEKKREILGVPIPYLEVPVAPGRNIAILVEVAVMNYRLRRKGIVAAQELEDQVMRVIREEEGDEKT
ncbi:MAG: HPr(Ser) kinase/phosphatase [Elusimicrobia bacterium]|nr:HPr(Ser) kinase/phosphatase [Elusimicrobiota bacterium]